MEGAPEIELVFGDTERYRHRVDRFYQLDEAMQRERVRFGENVQRALAGLAASKRGGCPVDAIAPFYVAAKKSGDGYRALGSELEAERAHIRNLDDLGETEALMPDYRWKVRNVEKLYRAALADLREMRLAFVEQLGGEVRHRGCRAEALAARGEALIAEGALDAPAVDPEAGPPEPIKPRRGEETPVVAASTATFFVDNRKCKAALDVYVDGELLGAVPAGERGAFQALAARHGICLIETGSGLRCGEPGTLRHAYVHDGWAIAMHCVD
jgi:hypothetical protein